MPSKEGYNPVETKATRLAAKKQEVNSSANQELEFATKFAEIINNTNNAFMEKIRELKLNDQQARMSDQEFLLWEQDYTDLWKNMKEMLKHADTQQEALAEAPIFAKYYTEEELSRTIEAQAAHYFFERIKSLQEAIINSNSLTSKQELRIINRLPGLVVEHFRLQYLTGEEVRKEFSLDDNSYNDTRTAVHNSVIETFNNINNLAIKYQTTPLTPRNYWISNKNKVVPPPVARRQRYDRDVIKEYCKIAFAKDNQQYKFQAKRKAQLFGA